MNNLRIITAAVMFLGSTFAFCQAEQSGRYEDSEKGFAIKFPVKPEKKLTGNSCFETTHYQSVIKSGKVSYNVTIQRFKDTEQIKDKTHAALIKDYLRGRALIAVDKKLQQKFVKFQDCLGARFQHKTLKDKLNLNHEGMVIFKAQSYISITCISTAGSNPAYSFNDFLDSFELFRP